MNVLVINCGSSSLKYQLINSDTEDVLAKGLCERIGIDGRLVYQKAGLDKEITECCNAYTQRSDPVCTGCSHKRQNWRYQEPERSRCNRTSYRTRRREICFFSSDHRRDDRNSRRVQRPCTTSQPGKPDWYPRHALNLCQAYRRLVYSIQLSIRQCLQKHICTDFRSNTTKTTK